jgi:hypothetical protein
LAELRLRLKAALERAADAKPSQPHHCKSPTLTAWIERTVRLPASVAPVPGPIQVVSAGDRGRRSATVRSSGCQSTTFNKPSSIWGAVALVCHLFQDGGGTPKVEGQISLIVGRGAPAAQFLRDTVPKKGWPGRGARQHLEGRGSCRGRQ